MHLNISSVKWQPFCQGGVANWTRIKHAVWPAKCISILMFGLIFTSFIGTFYGRAQWHSIKYLNIIDVMVWFSLAAFTWSKGNQYFTCCYEATMNSSASAWSVLLGELVTLRKYIWKIYQLSEVGLKWLIYFAADLAVSSKKLYL